VFYQEAAYLLGLLILAVGTACMEAADFGMSMVVALLFHTYIAPEAYELVVKEISAKHGWAVSGIKTAYDCISCLIAVCMSFAFFGIGRFEGVKLGTILCALINGTLIGRISVWLEAKFDFRDGLPLRRWFV